MFERDILRLGTAMIEISSIGVLKLPASRQSVFADPAGNWNSCRAAFSVEQLPFRIANDLRSLQNSAVPS